MQYHGEARYHEQCEERGHCKAAHYRDGQGTHSLRQGGYEGLLTAAEKFAASTATPCARCSIFDGYFPPSAMNFAMRSSSTGSGTEPNARITS